MWYRDKLLSFWNLMVPMPIYGLISPMVYLNDSGSIFFM